MTEQSPLAGMPSRLYRATPTRLTTWLDCPRRYRFAYLDRPPPSKGPPWAHNTLGAAVHLALAEWWRLPAPRRTVSAAGVLTERAWRSEGFRDATQSAEWATRSRAMVERYVAHLDPDAEPCGIERTVAVIHGGTALSGRVDRIDERGGELVVVDYKTGRHLLSVDDARSSLALAVYAAGTARTFRATCRRVELHHLPSGEIHVWEHGDGTIGRHLGRADDIATECATADAAFRAGRTGDDVFPPRPSSQCGWCDFRHLCPQGQANSAQRAPWAGLGPG